MPKLSTKKASAFKSILVYGAPFTGKSLLAGKLSEFYNLIWFDLENGHEVLLEQIPIEWQEKIELLAIPDTRSYPIAIETCLKVIKGPVDICTLHGKCACMVCKKTDAEFTHVDLLNLPDPHNTIVVFDSGTQLTNSAISHITKKESDDYKLLQDDWGHLGKLMDIFYSHIQNAPYHRIVISHEVETEGRKNSLVPIAGSKNFSRNVGKYFGSVVYADKKNKKHLFASSTDYNNTILAGTRSNVRLEDGKYPEAGLMPIFKPELYPGCQDKPEAKPGLKPTAKPQLKAKSTTSAVQKGGVHASKILERLRQKTQQLK